MKNPGFPGNLVLSAEELEKIGENDINNYFQMSVEMFDYMDEILTLQEAGKIFYSLLLLLLLLVFKYCRWKHNI